MKVIDHNIEFMNHRIDKLAEVTLADNEYADEKIREEFQKLHNKIDNLVELIDLIQIRMIDFIKARTA